MAVGLRCGGAERTPCPHCPVEKASKRCKEIVEAQDWQTRVDHARQLVFEAIAAYEWAVRHTSTLSLVQVQPRGVTSAGLTPDTQTAKTRLTS